MTNVPERWTAASWVESMRKATANGVNLYPYVVGVIESIVSDLHLSDTDKTARIREVLVARGQVVDPQPCVDPDPTGQLYSRPADDPQPSAGREPLHTGAVTDGGLVDESEPCYVPNGFQAPEVIAERRAYCASRHPGRACSEAD